MEYSDKVTVLHAIANTLRRAGITDKVQIIAKAKQCSREVEDANRLNKIELDCVARYHKCPLRTGSENNRVIEDASKRT